MKIHDFLNLNCKERENYKLLARALHKTEWLENKVDHPKEITLELLEELYKKVAKKYPARIAYIQNAGDESMLAMIKNTETHQWIETIYFVSFWECMAKVVLVLYGYFVKGIQFKDKDEKRR